MTRLLFFLCCLPWIYGQDIPTITLTTKKAFPDAWGEGADRIVGGRGGMKFFITSLDDTEDSELVPSTLGVESHYTGTFRAAMKMTVPVHIIPRVSGRVMLGSYFTVAGLNRSFQTFHGHLAPIGGFEVGGNTLAYSTINDVVFRFLKVRPGNNSRLGVDDGFEGVGMNRFIADHCSVSWGADETFSITGRPGQTFVDNILQRNIFGQSYVGHNTGSLIGYTSTEPNSNFKATIHNNLWTGVTHRTPNAAGDIDSEIRIYNNIVYDWVNRATNIVGAPKVDVAWNYLKRGPSMNGALTLDRLHQHQRNGYTNDPSIFTKGGFVTTVLEDPNADNKLTFTVFPNGVTTPLPDSYFRADMLPIDKNVGYIPVTALESYQSLIINNRDLGCNRNVDQDGNIVITHDFWDLKYLNSVRDNTNPKTPEDDWVHLPISGGTFYTDTNWNGILDTFESTYGITSSSQIILIWNFPDYTVINEAGYDAFEIWSAYAAGDFKRLSFDQIIPPDPQPQPSLGRGMNLNILLTQ